MATAYTTYRPFTAAVQEKQFSAPDAVYAYLSPVAHQYKKQYTLSGSRDFLTSAPNFIK
jgi:hypothetical protein